MTRSSLRAQQRRFAAHLRDPMSQPAPPGIEERRLAVYREVFLRNIDGLLSGNFPVIRQTLDDAEWSALVCDFYARHRSHTPLFTEIGREFIRHLETRAEEGHDDPPWLAELAHYEWVELALQISDAPAPPCDADGGPGSRPGQALLAGIPVLSPQAWALAYRWPVPRIGPGFRPTVPPEQPTLLLVRRDRELQVRFSELSPLMFRLLEILGAGDRSGREALQTLAAEAGVTELPPFIEQGTAMLERMREEGTVLGTR